MRYATNTDIKKKILKNRNLRLNKKKDPSGEESFSSDRGVPEPALPAYAENGNDRKRPVSCSTRHTAPARRRETCLPVLYGF